MLKVADELDQVLVAKAYKAEQDHVFRFWSRLTEDQQRALLDQLAGIDLQHLGRLTRLIDREGPARKDVAPIAPLVLDPARRAELAQLGWKALEAGQVACIMVAGGQGTRLGWAGSKGTYPVGPVTGKSLYQLFAEQILALGRRAGRALPWYVMTSRENQEETQRFFAEHGAFGLEPGQVSFIVQRELPSVDFRGKLVMASPFEIAMNPNGHGGVLQALRDGGALEAMAERGNEHLFYWQVDNPLCPVADPVFLGAHIQAAADASTKAVKKTDPDEKIGLLVDDTARRTTVIEYSEMSQEQKEARDPETGDLLYRAGNTAIHVFGRAFLQRLRDAGFELEHHVARKAVATIDEQGEPVTPEEPNAIKFETFVFDVLNEAETHVTLEVSRADEFEPLKNASGDYSPGTVRAALSERAARWLEQAGVPVERGPDARARRTYEVSPLTALDPDELAEKVTEPPEPRGDLVSV